MRQAMWVTLLDKRGVKRSINFDRVEYVEDMCNGTTKIVFSSGVGEMEGSLWVEMSYDAVAEAIAQVSITMSLSLASQGVLYGGHNPLKP
jgi:hypothetical protein